MPRRVANSPWLLWCSRRRRRRTEAAAIVLDGGGRWRRRSGRRRRFRASRSDSFGGEDEGDEAEILARVDLLGEAPNGGVARGTAAVVGWTEELGLGFSIRKNWEERVRGRESRWASWSLSTEGAGRERGVRRHGGTVWPLSPQWRKRRIGTTGAD